MVFDSSIGKEKFELHISSDKLYDLLGLSQMNGFAMPCPHPKDWTHIVDVDKKDGVLVATENISLEGTSFEVKTTVQGMSVLESVLDELKYMKQEEMYTKKISGISISYEIKGDARILPFVADCVNMNFWNYKESGTYTLILPSLSKVKEEVEQPIQVKWFPTLLEKQQEFLNNPPAGVDKEMMPIIEACSGFVNTNCSCAGGFKPLLKGKHIESTYRMEKMHSPLELFENQQMALVFANGGHLLPEDLDLYGVTDSAGIKKLDKVCEELKKDYPAEIDHPIGSDINPFSMSIELYRKKIPVKPVKVYLPKHPGDSLKISIDKLFEPYINARERFAELLKA